MERKLGFSAIIIMIMIMIINFTSQYESYGIQKFVTTAWRPSFEENKIFIFANMWEELKVINVVFDILSQLFNICINVQAGEGWEQSSSQQQLSVLSVIFKFSSSGL